MKKPFLLALLAIATATMVACGGKTDDGEAQKPEEQATIANITYGVSCGEDVPLLFDISVEYFNGTQLITESVTTSEWEKKVNGVKAPFECVFNVTYTAKSEYPAQDTYKMGWGYSVTGVTSEGGILFTGSTESDLTIGADQIAEYLDKYPTHSQNYSHSVK
ncbi:MAG: hypothetical protein LBM20_02810 [Rikenellaceae bacterium]|jgi:hypothetical protein|nr:hypothetical protein [Rikenellaceae bacterium]